MSADNVERKSEYSEAYFSLALNEYNRSVEMFHRLRERSAIVVSADMVVMTLVGMVAATPMKIEGSWRLCLVALTFLMLVCFLISALSSFKAIWPQWWVEISPEEVIESYSEGEWRSEEVARELLKAASLNRRIERGFEKWISTSIVATCLGLVLLAAEILLMSALT
jgi:hypothetical protein